MSFSLARITSQAARSAGLMNCLGSIHIFSAIFAFSARAGVRVRRSLPSSQNLGSMLCALSTRCSDDLCSQWTKNSVRCQQGHLYDVGREFFERRIHQYKQWVGGDNKKRSKLCVGCQEGIPHLGRGSPLGMHGLDLAREMALPLHPFVCAMRHILKVVMS